MHRRAACATGALGWRRPGALGWHRPLACADVVDGLFVGATGKSPATPSRTTDWASCHSPLRVLLCAAARVQEREQATAAYRTILNRNNAPDEGDAQELSRLMDVLEIRPAQLEADLASLQQAAALAAQLADADADAAKQARRIAQEAKTAFAVKRTAILTELNAEGAKIDAAVGAAGSRMQAAGIARNQLKDLTRGNRRLFGDEYADLIS